jgi:hypothetical protein
MNEADVDIWLDLGQEGQFKLPVLPSAHLNWRSACGTLR